MQKDYGTKLLEQVGEAGAATQTRAMNNKDDTCCRLTNPLIE